MSVVVKWSKATFIPGEDAIEVMVRAAVVPHDALPAGFEGADMDPKAVTSYFELDDGKTPTAASYPFRTYRWRLEIVEEAEKLEGAP